MDDGKKPLTEEELDDWLSISSNEYDETRLSAIVPRLIAELRALRGASEIVLACWRGDHTGESPEVSYRLLQSLLPKETT